jgi:hypothetical protein
MSVPSLGDLVVMVVAVSVVVAFFLGARHFIRRAEQNVTRED